MAVVLQSQAEMADRLGVIARLCHGAQQLMGNHLCAGVPSACSIMAAKSAVLTLALCRRETGFRPKAPTKSARDSTRSGAGLFVDTIYKGEVGAFRQLRRPPGLR